MICLHVSPFSSEAMSSPVYGCVKGELSGPDVVGYRSLESSTMLRTIFLIISLVVVDAGPRSSAIALMGMIAAIILLHDLQSISLAFCPLAHALVVRCASMAIRLQGHQRSCVVLHCVRMSICGILSTIWDVIVVNFLRYSALWVSSQHRHFADMTWRESGVP